MMNILSHRCTKGIVSLILTLFMSGTSFAEGWESENLSAVTLENLTAVWTTSSITPPDHAVTTEIFCTGVNATIIYFDGSTWTSQKSGGYNLNAIWGSSASNVFAGGDNGTIFYYDGSIWTSQPSGTNYNLNAIWGSSEDDVFAVGDTGTILHYDGSTWTPQDSGTLINLNAVWGSSTNDVFVVGDLFTILHYDGSSWEQFETNTAQDLNLNGIWGYAPNSIFAVGEEGTIIWYNGEVWALLSSGLSPSVVLNRVWGASACNVYAAGNVSGYGTIFHFDGISWSSQTDLISPSPPPLYGISGTSMRDIFVAGNQATFVRLELEGEENNPVICTTTPADGASDIATDTSIMALFSTEMDPGTITDATFTLTDGSSQVSGIVSYERGAFAIFVPDADLDYATTYTASLGSDIEDRFGYGIGSGTDYTWTFTTSEEPSSGSDDSGCFISTAPGCN